MIPPVRPIAIEDIEDARPRIAETVLRTPLVKLDLATETADIWLKLENLQPTNSYKIRGATNAVARLSDAEREEVTTAYRAIDEAPGVSPGVQMQPPETATTVRVQEGKTLTTDGPFVALDDALGGWFLLDADDLDAAIELASRVPAARMGGAVEVRPLVE